MHSPFRRAGSVDAPSGVDFNNTKTGFQKREPGHVKPKQYNAWDMLTLQDIIANHIENQERSAIIIQNRQEMKAYYDQQVRLKQEEKQHEKDIDRQIAKQIKSKVEKIDKLSTLNENARIMKRGTLAIENMGFVNKKKQKEQLLELASKQQTMAHLRMGEQVALQRHLAQADAQAAKKQENSRAVKAQIEENRKIAEKLRQEELN